VTPFHAALLSVVLVGLAAAQTSCPVCGDRGLVPCARHGDPAREDGVRWCSAVGACATCSGAGVVACPSCEAAGRPELAELQRRAAAQRASDARELDALAADTVTVEQERVRLTVGSARPFRIGAVSFDAHALAHRAAELVAEVRADFVATFGLAEGELAAPDHRTTSDPERLAAGTPSPQLRLLLFRDLAAARRASPRFVGLDLQGLGTLRLDARPTACVHLDPAVITEDLALRQLVAHLTARLSLAQFVGSPGEHGHGWIEAGVAHLFEARFGDRRNLFLGFGELVLQPTGTYRGGDFGDAVRRLAGEGKLRPFAALAALQHEDFDLEAHAQALAVVEFMLEVGGGPRWIDCVRKVLAGAEPVAVFDAAYRSADRSLDQRFAAWVLE
jgi:hypothetical protein